MMEILIIVVGYLIGSLSFAVIMSRLFGLPDPRTYGSGNPGATNVLRAGKRTAAALTLVGDAGKGWLAVVLAKIMAAQFDLDPGAIAGVALAVFVGHLWPLYFRFQGGKGVATAAGILLAIHPLVGAGSVITWILIFVFFRYSSLAALIAALFAPFAYLLFFKIDLMAAAVVAITFLLIWRHRDNVKRLLAGTEGRFGVGAQNSGEQ